MSRNILWTALFTIVLASGAAAEDEQQLRFAQIDVSGAKATTASGINTRGDVVGSRRSLRGPEHTSQEPRIPHAPWRFCVHRLPGPGVRGTAAFGINRRGHVVGQFADSAGVVHGFLLIRAEEQDRHHEERDDARHDE
jgi:hypothetical protein